MGYHGLLAILCFYLVVISCAAENCPAQSEILPCLCHKTSLSGFSVLCPRLDDFSLVRKTIAESFQSAISLSLINTKETEITDDYFKGVSLKYFSVLTSNISKIGTKAFENQINTLETISFHESKLTEIPVDALKKLEKLRTFAIRQSPINGMLKKAGMDKLPKSLKVFKVEESGITSLEDALFFDTSITFLSLFGNKLNSIPVNTFPSRHCLKTLILTNNNLVRLPTKALSSMADEASITLPGNPIEHLPSEEILKPLLLRDFNFGFYNNPIQCNAEIKWMMKFKRENPKHFKMYGYCTKKDKSRCQLTYLTPQCFL